jgi:hypothetical protein
VGPYSNIYSLVNLVGTASAKVEIQMSIFDLRQSVIDEYSKYVQSFLSISDDRIRSFIEKSLLKNQALWPDGFSQLSPYIGW